MRRLGKLVLFVFWFWYLPTAAIAGPADGRFDIYWIDVEGGAATLMVTPAGEGVLIDTGNPGRRDPDRIVQVATREAGLRRIDHLIVTHYHRDHYGGAATLARMLPIVNVHDNGIFDGMPERPEPEYFEFPCGERHVIDPGDRLPLLQADGADATQVEMTCLGTRKQFIAPPAGAETNEEICALHQPMERDASDNANSVVMLVRFGTFEFLDAGDLTWTQEQRLVCPVNLPGIVDVYQVTHHGLETSNNPVVLRSVQPTVAVMNNGVTKGCSARTFAALGETESLQAIYQMHKNLRPDGEVNNTPDDHIANLPRECDGNFIKLSVAPDAKSYIVSIPATGHRRAFKTK